MGKISFLGGAKEVGRSAILVETGSENILMDYGLKVDGMPVDFPLLPKTKINSALISHGHLDHHGALPALFPKNGFPVYTHEINNRFCELLWKDSLKISRQEGYLLKYSREEAKKALRNFKKIEYRKPFNIGRAEATAFDAGHIPGSAMFYLEANGKSILYTGDFKVRDMRLIKGCDSDIPKADVLITESTYSDTEQPNRFHEEGNLVGAVKGTLENNGVAVLACFAISRSQEILLILDEYDIDYPVYMDGMAWKATDIISAYPELQSEYKNVEKALDRLGVIYVDHPSIRKKIVKKPCIIIAGSGMLSGGPVVHYIKMLHKRDECFLGLTGYQVKGTPGDVLIKTGRFVNDELDLKMKMRFQKFDFSSHASRSELFEFCKKVNPERVLCMHGDKTELFANELRLQGFDATAVEINKKYSF